MPIPNCLRQLQTDGHLSGSALSPKMRSQLRTLMDSGVLEQQSNRRGAIIIVRNQQRFDDWIARQYPATESELTNLANLPRALAAAAHRNTKHGTSTHQQQILLARSPCPNVTARIDGAPWPIGELSRQYGIAACLITKATRLELPCPCVLVENQEVLLHCERILPNVQTILYSSGKISNIHIEVLSRSFSEADIFYHLPDYDPAGLSDYERLCQGFRDFSEKNGRDKTFSPRLFVPKNFEFLLNRYGNAELLQKPKNQDNFETLSLSTPGARQVFELIHQSGKVLEQESLLAASHSSSLNR